MPAHALPYSVFAILCACSLPAQVSVAGDAGSPAALHGVSVAGALHFPTNEELRHIRTLRDPRLSPDGRKVLTVIADSTADGGKTHLWLIDVGGGAPRQLTYSPESDKSGEHTGRWMPDGESVLFLAHRGEHTALYRLPMGGGEAKAYDLKVTPAVDLSKRADAIAVDAMNKEEGRSASESAAAQGAKTLEKKADERTPEPTAVDVAGFEISPDGRWIALMIEDPQTPGEKRLKEAKADAEWVDHDPHVSRLYLLDPATGKLTVTAGQPEVRSVAWSADSRNLLVISEAANGVSDLQPANSGALVRVSEPGRSEPLASLPATIADAAWSKDGTEILYEAQARQEAPPGVSDLYEYGLLTKNTVDRSPKLGGTLGDAELLTLANGGTDQLLELGVDGVLARFERGSETPQLLRLPVSTMAAAGTNEKETGWVFLGSDGAHASTLYFGEQQTSPLRALKIPALVPEGMKSVAPRRIRWKSDDFAIEGLLYLPEVAAGEKVPLVVDVHGGPTGVFQDRFDPFTQFLLGQGWAVLKANPRGSTGYGDTFAASNRDDLGGGDFRDIMAGVDFVLKTEPVDATRMALIGYSYGGEMAGFAESRTDRFRAIVSAAPVINQFSEYGTERSSYYDRWFYGYPWEHHESVWRQSPLAGIARAKTPFLLIQGESDRTDPLGQSQEMYRALRQAGVPVQLVTYPREDHGPLGNGLYGGSSTEPWHGFDARQRLVKFLGENFKAGVSSGKARSSDAGGMSPRRAF